MILAILTGVEGKGSSMASKAARYRLRAALGSAVLLFAAGCSSSGSQSGPAPTTIEPESNQSEGEGPSTEPTDEAGTATTSPSATEGQGGLLPFDGGSYTWANGVTMKLAVRRVEPWEKRRTIVVTAPAAYLTQATHGSSFATLSRCLSRLRYLRSN